jgi:uncharacterized protein YggE
MDNGVKISLIVTGTIIILALLGAFMFYSILPFDLKGNVITVNGQSTVKVNPDLVTVYFNAETNGSTSKEANDANALMVDNIITALVKLGFDREDIQTESLNIWEDNVWENDKYVSHGFKASHRIKVEMSTNQASMIGDVIDAGVNAGALLQWIQFELSSAKQNEYKALALKEAGLDARTKANAIAEGLGQKVGGIVSISTSDWGYNPWNVYTARSGGMMEDALMAKQAATNVQPGTQEVTGYITVRYSLR